MRSQDCRTSAHAILSEISLQSTEVFGQVRHLTSRGGLCRGNNESAGKRRSGRTRRGSTALRLTLTECALAAAYPHDSHFERVHRTLTACMGCKKAIVATAHKLLRILDAALRDEQPTGTRATPGTISHRCVRARECQGHWLPGHQPSLQVRLFTLQAKTPPYRRAVSTVRASTT